MQSTGFLQAPITMPESQCRYSPCPWGMHADLAEVTASGAFRWMDGNIGGAGEFYVQTDTTLNYGQTYHILGWTVLPSSDGTRFTNDGTMPLWLPPDGLRPSFPLEHSKGRPTRVSSQ
jgi:hypothetical protein